MHISEMELLEITSSSPQQTVRIAQTLARWLKSGDILCLYGDLGAGKTTFVKGLAKALKVQENKVNSPTFVLMNIYEGKLPLYHFDLYRLDDLDQMRRIGLDEFLYGEGVCVIEWADKLKELAPQEFLGIVLEHQDETTRRMCLKAHGERYEKLVLKIKEHLSL
jgi:tRNA threonylcarbamoyladenosine biosynthesis protein TsaE